MADNIQLSAAVGVGDIIAGDEIAGAKYQRVKLIHGADGVNAGDVAAANGLPVQAATGATFPVTDNSGSLTVDAPVGTPVFVRLSDGSGAIGTLPVSLASLPSNATVNLTMLAGGGVNVGNGTSGTGVLRVAQVSDGTGVLAGVTTVSAVTSITNPVTVAQATAANLNCTEASAADIKTAAERVAGKYVDFDTGAGTDSVVAIGLMLPGNGGAVIGGTASNPIRVDVTGTTTQPVSNADITAAAASLNIIDDWDETDRCKVNPIAGQAGVAAGAGAVGASTQRTTLASDDPAVVSLAILDDWDESDRAKVNVIAGQAGITAGAGAVAANTPRTTLASDDPAVAALAAIKTAIEILDNIVSGNEAQVDVLTLPNVTLAAGTNTNEVVGDAAHGAAVAGNPLLVGLEGRSTAPTAVDDGDVVRALATLLGKQINVPYALPANTWSYATATAGVTDTADDEAKAAVASTRNYVTSVQVINGHATVATEVVIKDGSAVLWRGWAEAVGGGVSAKFDPPLRGTANTAINVANITTGSKTYFNLQGFTATE